MTLHRSLTIVAMALLAVTASASADDKPRTVKVYAQPKPGSPPEDIDMRVHPVPTELNIVPADSINLPMNDVVVGVMHNGVVVAYPVRFLTQHEIVGDVINGLAIAPSWCALTGSAVVYGREVDGRKLTFEFGEGLMHDNLLFVDNETNSVWSQLHGTAIAGPLKDTPLRVIPSMQVTWRYWRGLYPESRVWLPEGEGHRYFYRTYQPGDDRPIKPDEHDTSRLGLGLVYMDSRLYFPFSELKKTQVPVLISFGDATIGIYYDKGAKAAWAVDGNLKLLPSVLVYDWAWQGFFPDSGVYKVDSEF